MIYFDTSYLLKCYLAEPGHEVVRQLVQDSSACFGTTPRTRVGA